MAVAAPIAPAIQPAAPDAADIFLANPVVRQPNPLPAPSAPVATGFPAHPSGDTSKSPLWIVLIAGLLVLAIAGYWFLLRPQADTDALHTDVPAAAVEAEDVAQDAARPAVEGEEEAIATDTVEASQETEVTVVEVAPPTYGDSVKNARPASQDPAQDIAGPSAQAVPMTRTAPPPAAPKPVVKPVKPVERQVADRPAAPPQLKFTPVDPQVARTLPPPPRAEQGIPATPVPVQAQPGVAGHASPEEACGKRVFLAMAMCMSRQCETPQFMSHPQCVKLRQQNKDRQDQVNQGR